MQILLLSHGCVRAGHDAHRQALPHHPFSIGWNDPERGTCRVLAGAVPGRIQGAVQCSSSGLE